MEHCHLSENDVWHDKIEFLFCVENYFVNNMGLFSNFVNVNHYECDDTKVM